MKTLYLLGSICGIILAIIFCYQHRPYIERTAKVINTKTCFSDKKECYFGIISREYDFCGEAYEILIPNNQKNIDDGFSNMTFIPCYKSKLKFR